MKVSPFLQHIPGHAVHEVPYGFAPPWLGQMPKRAWCHLSSFPPFFMFMLAVCETESTGSVGYLA